MVKQLSPSCPFLKQCLKYLLCSYLRSLPLPLWGWLWAKAIEGKCSSEIQRTTGEKNLNGNVKMPQGSPNRNPKTKDYIPCLTLHDLAWCSSHSQIFIRLTCVCSSLSRMAGSPSWFMLVWNCGSRQEVLAASTLPQNVITRGQTCQPNPWQGCKPISLKDCSNMTGTRQHMVQPRTRACTRCKGAKQSTPRVGKCYELSVVTLRPGTWLGT